jgi:hypothetical protein
MSQRLDSSDHDEDLLAVEFCLDNRPNKIRKGEKRREEEKMS